MAWPETSREPAPRSYSRDSVADAPARGPSDSSSWVAAPRSLGNPSLPDPPDWTSLVARIEAREESALEELYRVFSRGIRFFLCRQLGAQDLDDKVHDTFLIVVQAIQRHELRNPERLMGFVRTVVRRQIAAHIDRAITSRRDRSAVDPGIILPDQHEDPEEAAMNRQRKEIAAAILRSISSRDREILTRFYLNQQSQEQICREMNLSETQFRLLKSRAKARFGDIGKKKTSGRKFQVRGI